MVITKGTGNEIVRLVMRKNDITQMKLANLMGYEYQGNISTIINSQRMSLDKFVGMMNAMGKTVYVGEKTDNMIALEYEVSR